MKQQPYFRVYAIELGAGLAALLIGVLVYALGRPAGSVPFLAWLSFPGGLPRLDLPAFSACLPSFVHIYAFILFTYVFTSKTRYSLLGVSVFWLIIELTFEILQNDYFSQLFDDFVRHGSDMKSVARPVLGYFIYGRYDSLDMLALILGALAAYGTVILLERKA